MLDKVTDGILLLCALLFSLFCCFTLGHRPIRQSSLTASVIDTCGPTMVIPLTYLKEGEPLF